MSFREEPKMPRYEFKCASTERKYTISIQISDYKPEIECPCGIDGCLAQIVAEFSPLMYKSTGTAGKIFMIVHGHGQSAASMQVRLQNMGTVDSIDLSSATVTARDLDGFVAT